MPPREHLRTARSRAQLTAGVRDWYRIVNKAGDEDGTAQVYVYDEIGYLGIGAQQFVDELGEITAERIDLHLNTPGGEVWDGLAIHNAIRRHKANVTVHVDGLAASIGSVIAMAGDRVVMGRGSQMMIHDALGICIGNAADMREMVELLDRASDSIAGLYAEKAGGTVDQWRNRMRDETWYFGPEALKAGLADEVVGAGEPHGEPAVTDQVPDRSDQWDLTIFRYPGRGKAPDPATDTAQQPPPGVQLTYNGQPADPATVAAELVKLARTEPAPPVDTTTPDVAPSPVGTVTPVHHTDTVDRQWDSDTHVGRLDSPMTLATARAMYAWYDSDRVDDGQIVKDACSLPHHEVSGDGEPGAANLAGVRNALSRLSQSDIPESDHAAIRRHLQTHLDDAPDEDTTDELPAAQPENRHDMADVFRRAIREAVS